MFIKFCTLILCVFFGTQVFARGRSMLDLDVSQSHYWAGSSLQSQSDSYTVIGVHGDFEDSGKYLGYKFTPVFQGTLGESEEIYFGAPEAYLVQRAISPGFNLAIGRSLRHWSRLDEEFNVGIWQPQLRWDYLAPQQEGLTGIFFDWDLGNETQLTLFTSPIAIPDQGPRFELENGRFTAANRWFYRPQSRFQMFQKYGVKSSANLYYDIDSPRAEELVMHSSFGVALKMRPAGPFWVQLAYAYKPMNQIHIGLECTNCVSITTLDTQVKIHPSIVKHNVVSLESGFEQSDRKGYISITGDVPNQSEMPSDWEESSLHSMAFLGGAFEHFVAGVRYPLWLRYSYMKAIEFTGRHKNGFLGDKVESSLDRYPFRDVAAIGGRLLLSQAKSHRISLSSRYLYSLPEQGGWLNMGFEWGQDNATWQLGIDLLGADTDPSSSKAGLLSRYRANDRITGGLSYVF